MKDDNLCTVSIILREARGIGSCPERAHFPVRETKSIKTFTIESHVEAMGAETYDEPWVIHSIECNSV